MYQHLIGRPFKYGTTDCYDLLRCFYRDVFEIELPNFARPNDFWNQGIDLYSRLYHKAGFRPIDVHPSEYQFGDVFLMAVRSPVSNHVGVLVENGELLHHLWGQRSSLTPYRGIWRNTTTGVFRHKDVKLPEAVQTQNIMDFLPANIRRKIDAALENPEGIEREIRL